MAIGIAVANQKGGVGKTTTSIMLAQELARAGKRTLIVDLDAQMNTTMFYRYGEIQFSDTGSPSKIEDIKSFDPYNVDGIATVVDILCDDVPANECVQHLKYGDIIYADRQLSEAETSVHNDVRRFYHLKESLKSVDNDYDYIVIDTPPMRGVILRNGLACADQVLIPAVEDGWSLDGLIDLNKDIEDMRQYINKDLETLGIVIVKSKPNTNKSKMIAEKAEELAGSALNTRVMDTVIRESVKISEAMTVYCVPLYEYAPHCGPQVDYEFLTAEIIEMLEGGRRD